MERQHLAEDGVTRRPQAGWEEEGFDPLALAFEAKRGEGKIPEAVLATRDAPAPGAGGFGSCVYLVGACGSGAADSALETTLGVPEKCSHWSEMGSLAPAQGCVPIDL